MALGLDIIISEMRVVSRLRKVAALLAWDQETYMPTGGAAARADQLSLILSLAHGRFTGSDFRHSLGQFVDLESGQVTRNNLQPHEIRMLEMTWRDWRHDVSIPVEFIRDLALLTSKAQQVWEQAREKSDFALFAPYLEKIVVMKRQEAEYLGYQDEPYDALIDIFEPGMTSRKLEALFNALRPVLVNLSTQIRQANRPNRRPILTQNYEESIQWEFGLEVLTDMGYDFSRGRQDRSAHPFTTDFHPTDVRITTRLNPNDLAMGLFGTIHEGGHALYEQGLDERYFGTPLCEAISLGIHESQSRLWENYVGRSRPFWMWYYPRLQKLFPGQLGKVSLDDFYAAINAVAPTPIRVEADEVTYNLHIMLRFDLERAMLNGSVAIKDLPELWNAKMQEYLGITPKNDAEGVLQDIHWSLGAIGYFPTYTLGNLYGRQLYEAARQQIDGLEDRIAKGDLKSLREWLHTNIYRVGRAKTADELMLELSGRSLSTEPFNRYLEDKYGQLYDL